MTENKDEDMTLTAQEEKSVGKQFPTRDITAPYMEYFFIRSGVDVKDPQTSQRVIPKDEKLLYLLGYFGSHPWIITRPALAYCGGVSVKYIHQLEDAALNHLLDEERLQIYQAEHETPDDADRLSRRGSLDLPDDFSVPMRLFSPSGVPNLGRKKFKELTGLYEDRIEMHWSTETALTPRPKLKKSVGGSEIQNRLIPGNAVRSYYHTYLPDASKDALIAKGGRKKGKKIAPKTKNAGSQTKLADVVNETHDASSQTARIVVANATSQTNPGAATVDAGMQTMPDPGLEGDSGLPILGHDATIDDLLDLSAAADPVYARVRHMGLPRPDHHRPPIRPEEILIDGYYREPIFLPNAPDIPGPVGTYRAHVSASLHAGRQLPIPDGPSAPPGSAEAAVVRQIMQREGLMEVEEWREYCERWATGDRTARFVGLPDLVLHRGPAEEDSSR